MSTGGAGVPALAGAGSVVGHSYTAAYRYQLVIGKVGGWAIPYPLTIPQAITGLGSMVLAVVTASWWYPLTGAGGALGVIVLPLVAIRVIARIRPEGRSVSDWLYGWGVAQQQGLTGRGVRLWVGCPQGSGTTSPPMLTSAPSPPSVPSSPTRRSPTPTRQPVFEVLANKVGWRRHHAPKRLTPTHRASGTRPPTANHRAQRPMKSTRRWPAFTRLFTKPTPPPEPERVPVFDPWGITPASGGAQP